MKKTGRTWVVSAPLGPSRRNARQMADAMSLRGAVACGVVVLGLTLFGDPARSADDYLAQLCTKENNCKCSNNGFCVTQLSNIKNPKYVHLKVIGYSEDFIQIRQGNKQQEVKPGQQTYVTRKAQGYTTVSVQACRSTGVFGSACSGWEVFTLDNSPPGERFGDCDTYADKTMGQVQQAGKITNCNVKGDRWSKDRKHHYNWCMGLADANYGLAKTETDARKKELNGCKGVGVATPAPPPPPKNYTGTWDVTLSGAPFTLVLTQQGPAITGQLINADPQANGTLQGSVEADGRAKFSYVQPQTGTGGSGRFWLEGTVDKLGGRFFFNGQEAVRLLEGTRK